jgi:hypothetical protein
MSGISQEDAFHMLARRLDHARKEHPVFAHDNADASGVILSEVDELLVAIVFDHGQARIIDEALDVAATAMRLVMGEVEE